MKVVAQVILLLVFLTFTGDTRAAEVQEYMPLGEGREWTYRVAKTRTYVLPDRKMTQQIIGTSVERSSGLSNVIELAAPVFVVTQRTRETNQSTGRVAEAVIETYLSCESDQILMHAQRIQGVPAMEGKLERFAPPVTLLKLPIPSADEPYPSITKAYGMTIDSRPYAKSTETVQTAAGIFKDCLRISTRGPVSGVLPAPQPLPIRGGSVEETLWFAKGVGQVKALQVLRMRVHLNGQQVETTEEKTKVLIAYR